MKRFLLLLSSGLLLTSSAFAQAGLRVGGSLLGFRSPDQLPGAESVERKAQVGYQVGGYYQVGLGKYFSVVPELQFSREQQRVIETSSYLLADTGFASDYRVSLSYLNVPVLLRAALGPVYLEAGPQVSLLVGGRETGQTESYYWGGGTSRRPIDYAATNSYHRFDAGFCLGVGVKLPAGLGLNLRAYQGMRQLNTYDPGTPLPVLGTDRYRKTLQASLTYQLAAR